MAHQLELFFVFVSSNVVHFAKLVDLSQSQASLAQVSQLRLAVVLRHVLIGFRLLVPKFLQYHTVIYAAGGAAAGGIPVPPGATPGAAAPPRSPPKAPAGSMAPISSPVEMSVSRAPGVIPRYVGLVQWWVASADHLVLHATTLRFS